MDTKAFREGFRDGIPIGLGYLAVSFSLGISAKQAGLTPLQGFVTSFLENASAGEYIAFTLIGAGATYIELCLMTIIANARYLLMSCAMSQRFSPDTPMIHRFLVAFDLTDELFGIAIGRPGYLNPYYSYGAFLVALPGWSHRNRRRCHRRQSAAGRYGKSTQRFFVWYVSGNHHPACQKRQSRAGVDHHQFCSKLPVQPSPGHP